MCSNLEFCRFVTGVTRRLGTISCPAAVSSGRIYLHRNEYRLGTDRCFYGSPCCSRQKAAALIRTQLPLPLQRPVSRSCVGFGLRLYKHCTTRPATTISAWPVLRNTHISRPGRGCSHFFLFFRCSRGNASAESSC